MDGRCGECYAAILAGGAGTRFWPASRRAFPKPFLDLFGRGPLVRRTAERIAPVVGSENVLFVLGSSLVEPLRTIVPDARAVGEPVARNTLGAVLLAIGYALSRDEKARVALLPADHVIPDVDAFQETMRAAFHWAESKVVTLGIVPSYPETGYGYIRHTGRPATGVDGAPHALQVEGFTEKPDFATAARFVASGEYYWNAGIFVLPAARFRETARSVDPYFGEMVDRVTEAFRAGEPDDALLTRLLEPLPNLNIDRAVIERCEDLVVIPANFGWSDVGTWDAAYDLRAEGAGNLEVGEVTVRGGEGNVAVRTPGAPALILQGVSDLVAVATPDAVLVTRRGAGQEVGEVVKALEAEGREELL